MPKLLPDQSFYPSPTMAMQAPVETLAYVALLNPDPTASDALAVLDVDPASAGYGAQIARVKMPGAGDELHHFGWNACSSCLCPNAPHPHMQRRYLVAPGMRSSRIHILDTVPEPAAAAPRQGDRGRRSHSQDRVQPSSHRALRARRDLHQRARRSRGQRPWWHLRHGPGDIRDQGPLGKRAWTAAPGVRLLVAARARHDDHERMGHAEHGGERREPGKDGWPRSTCARPAASSSIAPDSWSSTACVRTRSTWRAAMPAPTPTVSREDGSWQAR